MIWSEKLQQATHLEVEAAPRYWEDATINGVVDEDGSRIFGRDGDLWKVRIDLAHAKIEGWPNGMVADIHFKAPEGGEYFLLDAAGRRLAKWKMDSVPSDFLCHGGCGYGDYIILQVSGQGEIARFKLPRIDPDRWQAI